jgi:hypothetical protein
VHDALRPTGVRVRQTALSAPNVRALLRESGVVADPLGGLRFRGLNLPAADVQ